MVKVNDIPFTKCPYLAVDMVARWQDKIVVIERKFSPLGHALPGGFVDYGETTLEAAKRELKEETNLDGRVIELVGVFSDPKRDPRAHVVSVAYAMEAEGTLKAKDDAKAVKALEINDALAKEYVADHNYILASAITKVFNRREW